MRGGLRLALRFMRRYQMALILVVDDEDYLRTLSEQILKPRGHDVVQARSGKEAVILCQQLRIDLVITDLAMPDMDGLELIRSLGGSHDDRGLG